MGKRYEPKGEYFEEDGRPVDWSKAKKHDLLFIEKHELEEEIAQANPGVLTLRRLQAVDRQLRTLEEKTRAEEAAREAPWNAESRVESRLKTGGTDPGAYFSRRG